LMVTMSQKSSVPQTAKSVSQALMSDKAEYTRQQLFARKISYYWRFSLGFSMSYALLEHQIHRPLLHSL
jgi:hypothetical protein